VSDFPPPPPSCRRRHAAPAGCPLIPRLLAVISNNDGRLSKQEFVQLLDHLNRSKDEEDHKKHADRKMSRLFELHRHKHGVSEGEGARVKNEVRVEEDPDASADQVDLGLSPTIPGEDQEHILADMWEHIVKQTLGPGETVDGAEMNFEQFRAW
jgi:hypothetical protein